MTIDYGERPWAIALILASVVVVLVFFGTIVRRKRQLRAKSGPARVIGPPGQRDVHGLHTGRATGGWRWTPNRTAPTVVEGLNEYGEAPPPYAGDGNDLEMQAPSSGRRTAAAAGGGDGNRQGQATGVPPVVGATQDQQASAGLPPSYGKTDGAPAAAIRPPYVDVTRSVTVAEPPPAVLPSYRPSYT